MSKLAEKRKEVAEKLERLMNERQEKIKVKLDAYREELEKEPLSEEIINTKTVLNAIDDIIKYEDEALSKIEIVENLAVKEEDIVTELPKEAEVTETIIADTVEIIPEETKEEVKEEIKEEAVEEIKEVAEDNIHGDLGLSTPNEEGYQYFVAPEMNGCDGNEIKKDIEENKIVVEEEVKKESCEVPTEKTMEIKVEVNAEGKPEIKADQNEARPGMAYIGIPERR